MHTCMRACAHTHTHTHIRTHAHTNIHTHTHTQTHTHTHILTSWVKVILKNQENTSFFGGACTPGLKITTAAYYAHTNSLYTIVSLPLMVNLTVALGAPTGKLALLLPQVYVP